MGKISIIGSLNIDLIVQASRIPEKGETIEGVLFQMIPGGKGANQAVAASLAGANAYMFGCVGSDPFGEELIKSISRAGVKSCNVEVIKGVNSGIAAIILETSGDNRIITVPGANGQIKPDYIERYWDQILDSSLIILQHEIPIITVEYIVNKAFEHSIPVLLNPAPYYPISNTELRKINYLILNENEASRLTGVSINGMNNALMATKLIKNMGVENVIITLGSEGSILNDSNNEIIQPSFKVPIVDTTAAGDTFVGYFAALITAEKSLKESMEFASAAAALTVTRIGAQSSIPTYKETNDFLISYGKEEK